MSVAALVLMLAGCAEETVGSAPATMPPLDGTKLKSSPINPDAPSTAEARYLDALRPLGTHSPLIERATDTQLLVAGWQACAEINEGAKDSEIVVLEGEKRDARGVYRASGLVVSAADLYLC